MKAGSWGGTNKKFTDYRSEISKYKALEITSDFKNEMRQEFLQRSLELEKLKAGYLVAEKVVLEINNCQKIQSLYIKDMLDILQRQLNSAYRAICQLRSEIDKNFCFVEIPHIYLESEDIIRLDLLNKLINTTLYHMEKGSFVNTSTFRAVVSACAAIIRFLRNEDYGTSDKSLFAYYLGETVGLKTTQHKCCNCGKPLLNYIGYCLNCYETAIEIMFLNEDDGRELYLTKNIR